MNGLLIIDKPQGMSSHAVVGKVRRLFGLRKVGHAGTLDPLATGVLVVALGQGTRILQFLLEENKTYRATLKLGAVTDTQDSEGVVLSEAEWSHLGEAEIAAACQAMVGTLEQVPPMYSAIKQGGVPLYKLARKGMEVERQPRLVTIFSLGLVSISPPDVTFEVHCSKGTYVRTLCHDIGTKLGCGAYLTALRRLTSGAFNETEAVSLDTIEQTAPQERGRFLLSLGDALRGYAAVFLREEGVRKLRYGIPPTLDMVEKNVEIEEGTIVQLLGPLGPMGMARFAPSRGRETRGDFELLRVFNDCDGGE